MSEGGKSDIERTGCIGHIDSTKLWVLIASVGVRRDLSKEFAEHFAGERHERDAGVGSHRRDGAERGTYAPEGAGLGTDDGRGLGLHHEAAKGEGKRRVVVSDATEASDFPGVEGGIRDAIAFEVEREDARITSRRSGFEHTAWRKGSLSQDGERSP